MAPNDTRPPATDGFDDIPPLTTIEAEVKFLRLRRNVMALVAAAVFSGGAIVAIVGGETTLAARFGRWMMQLSGAGAASVGLVPLNDTLKWTRRLRQCVNFSVLVAAWQRSPDNVKETTLREMARWFWKYWISGWDD